VCVRTPCGGNIDMFSENVCSHLSFGEWIRGFDHLVRENPPLCFMLLGRSSISFASL
jgi:hypothetical protein